MGSFRDLHHTDDTLSQGKLPSALSLLTNSPFCQVLSAQPGGFFHTTFHRVPGGDHLGEFISFKDLHLCSILPPSFFNYTVMFWKAWALSYLFLLQRLPHLKVADTPKVTWKWVFSAAFSNSTAFLYANSCACQKCSWVQMTKTGFQLA